MNLLRNFVTVTAVTVFAMLAPEASLLASSPSCEAAIVYRSGSEAYDEALAGIRENPPETSCVLRYVDLENPADGKWLEDHAGRWKLAVALGIGMYQRIASRGPGAAVIPAIVLREDLKSAPSPSGAVYADVPLAATLENLRGLFPARLRVALIHRPGRELPDAATLARIHRMGYELRVVDCAGPEKLLAVFSSLKGSTDFVVAEPDPELYNSATIKPLVLASLGQRLPIVGFSAAFVRAGALVGVYPDFRDLGRQTAELMNRILESNLDGRRTEPEVRSVVVTVNSRVARLLGLEPVKQESVRVLK